MRHKARLVTDGKTLKSFDDSKGLIRKSDADPLGPSVGNVKGAEVPSPVDYERLWRRNREDVEMAFGNLIEIANTKMCPPCRTVWLEGLKVQGDRMSELRAERKEPT